MRSLYACVDSSGSLFGIKRRANVGCRRINFAVSQTGHFAERSRPACFRCVQRDGGSRHIADSHRSVHRRTAPSAGLTACECAQTSERQRISRPLYFWCVSYKTNVARMGDLSHAVICAGRDARHAVPAGSRLSAAAAQPAPATGCALSAGRLELRSSTGPSFAGYRPPNSRVLTD